MSPKARIYYQRDTLPIGKKGVPRLAKRMSLIRKNIVKLVSYQPGKPIEEVKRQLGLKQGIKLASNENPLGGSLKARKAITKTLGEINRYPEGSCFYLRNALSRKLKLKPNQLIFGNGSDELIDIIIKTFVENDEGSLHVNCNDPVSGTFNEVGQKLVGFPKLVLHAQSFGQIPNVHIGFFTSFCNARSTDADFTTSVAARGGAQFQLGANPPTLRCRAVLVQIL